MIVTVYNKDFDAKEYSCAGLILSGYSLKLNCAHDLHYRLDLCDIHEVYVNDKMVYTHEFMDKYDFMMHISICDIYEEDDDEEI